MYMNEQEIWQRLRALESFDNVQKWFGIVHKRNLNSRRTTEIICSAKQAREFFLNAKQSDYSVRSLLTFYGIASLSRAVTLLFKENGGEETLTKGHGLEVCDWSSVLSGDISEAIAKIGLLQVSTCKGLFNDFLTATKNTLCMHINSSGIDWTLPYTLPELGVTISLADLLSRLPDFSNDIKNISSSTLHYAVAGDISYSPNGGFKVKVGKDACGSLLGCYERKGYTITNAECSQYILTCSSDVFCKNMPLFLHDYTNKMFGSIPQLYIIEVLENGHNYSEMGFCYLLAYFMGMLSRYYPTHWVSLISGRKGDLYWPIINRAQNYLETVFPELIVEYIENELKKE